MNGDLSTSCNLSNCDCDKPKPMPDQRARALIARYDLVDVTRCGEGWREMQRDDQYGDWVSYEDHIATLTDERRRVWEEAKLIADTVAAKHPAPEDWMARLAAVSISNLMDAKSHAGQEG